MAGRFALIIASGAYRDPKLSRLRTPTHDAEALARVLRDPEVGDFDVDLAVDEPEAALRRRIAAFFSDRARDDLLLLHFSCHGLKDDSGQLYFAATDTEVDQLDATAVSAQFVSRQMTRSRSRKVVALLDCCYSGAIARGLTFRGGDRVDLDDHLGGSGRVILTASSAMEYAFEGDELTGTGNPSVFTTAVVKGLETGEADRDQDHRISVEELYDYVCDQVREVTPDQSPNMLSHLEGELYVARSAYVAPVEAAELSPEVRAAIDSPLAGVRAGVVNELARLLEGHDPALAEAARRALTHLAEDDSRRVSATAAAAAGIERQASRPRLRPPLPEGEGAGAGAGGLTPPTVPVAPTAAAGGVRPPKAASEPAKPAAEPSSPLARWGPLGVSVLGALLVVASLAVFASNPWGLEVRDTEIIAVVAVVGAAAIAALSTWGVRRRALDALEPFLAGFPIGLAAGMGGLKDVLGIYFSVRAVAFSGALLVASVVWRRSRERARPSWVVVAAVVLASLGLFVSTGAEWWGDTVGSELVEWPLIACLALGAVLATVAVAVGRSNGGATWAVLVAAAGGMTFAAVFTIGDYMDNQGLTAQAGYVIALVGSLILTAASVLVLWRAYDPSRVGSARRSSRSQ